VTGNIALGSAELRREIADLGGLPPLLALCRHSADERVLNMAGAATWSMASADDENRAAIIAMDGIGSVVAMLRRSTSDKVHGRPGGCVSHTCTPVNTYNYACMSTCLWVHVCVPANMRPTTICWNMLGCALYLWRCLWLSLLVVLVGGACGGVCGCIRGGFCGGMRWYIFTWKQTRQGRVRGEGRSKRRDTERERERGGAPYGY